MSDVFSSPLSVAIAAAVGGALAAISISNALSNLGAAAQQGGFSRGGRRRSERQDDEHRRDYDSEGGKFAHFDLSGVPVPSASHGVAMHHCTGRPVVPVAYHHQSDSKAFSRPHRNHLNEYNNLTSFFHFVCIYILFFLNRWRLVFCIQLGVQQPSSIRWRGRLRLAGPACDTAAAQQEAQATTAAADYVDVWLDDTTASNSHKPATARAYPVCCRRDD